MLGEVVTTGPALVETNLDGVTVTRHLSHKVPITIKAVGTSEAPTTNPTINTVLVVRVVEAVRPTTSTAHLEDSLSADPTTIPSVDLQ